MKYEVPAPAASRHDDDAVAARASALLRNLSRLERGRNLLAQSGFDTATAKLACYSGSGFDDHLREAAASRTDVLLVDPEQLYA